MVEVDPSGVACAALKRAVFPVMGSKQCGVAQRFHQYVCATNCYNCAMGISHLSFAVDDLQAMADALIAKGVQIAGELQIAAMYRARCAPFLSTIRTISWYNASRLTQASNHHSSLNIPDQQRCDDCYGQRWYQSSCCADWPAGQSAGLVGIAALMATRHQR